MALDLIVPSAPAQTFSRINAAISALNAAIGALSDVTDYGTSTRGSLNDLIVRVSNIRTDISNLTRNTDNLSAGIDSLAEVTGQQIAQVQANLDAAIDRLVGALAVQRLQFVSAVGRPGDSPERFTSVPSRTLLSGSGTALPLIPDAQLQTADYGRVVRVIGSSVIASRLAVPVENGRIHGVRYVVQRRTNASDPSNDSVVLGIIWLDANLHILPPANDITIVEDIQDLSVSYGRQERVVLFSRSLSPDAQFQAPMRARYARIYVQNYGPDGITDVEVLSIEDISAGTVLAPETADTVQRVGALESQDAGPRLTALEAAVGAPNSVTFATKSDAASGSIPTTVTTVSLRGLVQAGDGGDGIYKPISGTAPAGSDSFINQGVTFVRVYTSSDVLGALLLSLPTSLPAVPGKAWLNGGILAVS